jgi:hypothetical protein
MNGFRVVFIAAAVFSLSLTATPLNAQLADTIWEGTQWISSINIASLKPDGSANFPSLLGARFNLPLEIWFWDNTHFGIVFRNDRWGFEGRRKGEYTGHPEANKVFTYRLKGKAGTFSVKEFDDYFALQVYSGRLTLNGNKLTTDRVTYSAPTSGFLYENTELANIPCKRVGNLPVFENTVWTKTNRKPSTTKDESGYLTDP